MIPDTYINTILDLVAVTKKPSWCTITGNSMAPMLRHGDTLLVHPGNRDVRIGDVVIFRLADRQMAHRIVGFTEHHNRKRYLLKGDNLYHFDQPVLQEQILAKVLLAKGPHGTLNFTTVTWRGINFLIAIYSHIEARRHERKTLFWRCFNRGLTHCRSYELLKRYGRHDLFLWLINRSKTVNQADTKGVNNDEGNCKTNSKREHTRA